MQILVVTSDVTWDGGGDMCPWPCYTSALISEHSDKHELMDSLGPIIESVEKLYVYLKQTKSRNHNIDALNWYLGTVNSRGNVGVRSATLGRMC